MFRSALSLIYVQHIPHALKCIVGDAQRGGQSQAVYTQNAEDSQHGVEISNEEIAVFL